MLTFIRKRAGGEEGMSLVEMLVALLVLTIALSALASGLIASAQSLTDQRARSTATRVATRHLEGLRQIGYQQIVDDDAAGAYDTPITVTERGIDYDISFDVEVVDAVGGGAPVIGQPRLARVQATVQWTERGSPHVMTFDTAVAPDDHAAGGQQVKTVNVNPNPTAIDDDGNPTEDLEVKIVLDGFEDSAIVGFEWTNDGGVVKTMFLTSADGGVTWTGTIDADDVVHAVAEDSEGELDFTIKAGDLPDQLYTLPLIGPASEDAEEGPEITSATVSPSPIIRKSKQGNCQKPDWCTNTSAVTFSATVTGLDTSADPIKDTVRVKYELHDGTTEELPLTYDPVSGEWSLTLASNSTKFKSGTGLPFYFLAMRVADDDTPLATDTVTVPTTVLEAG